MTSNRDRQRANARARLEREMAERAERSHRRRRTQLALAGAATALLVIAGVVWLVVVNRDDSKRAGASPSASGKTCDWGPLVDPSASPKPSIPAEIKEVGKPPVNEPRSGTQLMTMTTNLGVVKIEMDTSVAPCAAASFTYLAGKKFFDGSKCHRMVTQGIYVLQCGDPSATGKGGPSYRFAEENLPENRRPAYPEGAVALANTGQPASSGSQFFIVYKDTDLPAKYTIFGRVTEGLDIIKKVAEAGVTPAADAQGEGDGAPKTEVKITSVTVGSPVVS